ncbi:MAG: hypothetical protein GQ525_06275 [Draconibacterium sp.]|nr:hypothetical protein [Draconibacterium sp.]
MKKTINNISNVLKENEELIATFAQSVKLQKHIRRTVKTKQFVLGAI